MIHPDKTHKKMLKNNIVCLKVKISQFHDRCMIMSHFMSLLLRSLQDPSLPTLFGTRTNFLCSPFTLKGRPLAKYTVS